MIGRLHVLVFRYPAFGRATKLITVAGREWASIQVDPDRSQMTFPCSFEVALQRLGRLPRFFGEPDGSFVWVQDQVDPPWQLDGQLDDGPTGLMSLEARGVCSAVDWNRLMVCLGCPTSELVYQCVREGIALNQQDFHGFVWGI